MFVKKGYKGDDVLTVQKLLNKRGFALVLDGDFGRSTHNAVVAFQKRNGLLVDGIVGGGTYTELKKSEVKPTAPKPTNANQPWMGSAYRAIGIKEIKGSKHHPDIVQYWKDIKRGGIKNDETPWCAAYVGAMLERNGIRSSRFESAKSYLDWGVKLDKPVDGCVVVFTRSGGGHVGFVVGQTKTGNLLVLGGNQGDAVNIKEFKRNRVKGYRYPVGFEPSETLTLGDSKELSKNEA